MALLRLYKEDKLLAELQGDTVQLIHHCHSMQPIKKLVQCFDILELTLKIAYKFPTVIPDLPQCDEGALRELQLLLGELAVYHHIDLPSPEFPRYNSKVKRLLQVYAIPRGKS